MYNGAMLWKIIAAAIILMLIVVAIAVGVTHLVIR